MMLDWSQGEEWGTAWPPTDT